MSFQPYIIWSEQTACTCCTVRATTVTEDHQLKTAESCLAIRYCVAQYLQDHEAFACFICTAGSMLRTWGLRSVVVIIPVCRLFSAMTPCPMVAFTTGGPLSTRFICSLCLEGHLTTVRSPLWSCTEEIAARVTHQEKGNDMPGGKAVYLPSLQLLKESRY